MNILLAGGAGYIGSHTAVELLTAGHDVVIVDNYCNSCAEAVNRVEEVSGKKVVSYEADVKDKVAMAKIFAENKDVTAVMCGNDQIALGALVAARTAGLTDVKIYGVDGSPDLKK